MNVEQIPGEQRFLVDSETREEVKHLVDLSYQEGREKPHPACSCEDHMTRGRVCKHIVAVQQFTKQHPQLGIKRI